MITTTATNPIRPSTTLMIVFMLPIKSLSCMSVLHCATVEILYSASLPKFSEPAHGAARHRERDRPLHPFGGGDGGQRLAGAGPDTATDEADHREGAGQAQQHHPQRRGPEVSAGSHHHHAQRPLHHPREGGASAADPGPDPRPERHGSDPVYRARGGGGAGERV